MSDYLPEELIVKNLEWLPVESLIRFTSVSKRWRSIILSDPDFAKSHFQKSSHHPRHRVLISITDDQSELESHDLAASPSSKVIKCPFPRYSHLCSCNGLVCAHVGPENHFYIWNPTTGFFYALPEPTGYPLKHVFSMYFGFGYLSASDDYKLVSGPRASLDDDGQLLVFSFKANVWKSTDAPLGYRLFNDGTLSNEALHWMDNDIVAFDLAKEEFQRMPLPVVVHGKFRSLGVLGDSLCVFDEVNLCTSGSIDMWVMETYGVADSWTKLFNFKIINQPWKMELIVFWPMLVLEATTFMIIVTFDRDKQKLLELTRVSHTKDEPDLVLSRWNTLVMECIQYEETLLWLAPP